MQLHSRMEETYSGLKLPGERCTGGLPSHISVTFIKSLFSSNCWIILFLNSQINHATSTHISTAASVSPEINTSACLPGMQEGKFPSPKASQTHTCFAVCQTPGNRQSPGMNNIAVLLHGLLHVPHSHTQGVWDSRKSWYRTMLEQESLPQHFCSQHRKTEHRCCREKRVFLQLFQW